MKKMNIDFVQVASIAGSLLTVAATLLTSYANDKKMDETIEKKVSEILTKQLNNNSSGE